MPNTPWAVGLKSCRAILLALFIGGDWTTEAQESYLLLGREGEIETPVEHEIATLRDQVRALEARLSEQEKAAAHASDRPIHHAASASAARSVCEPSRFASLRNWIGSCNSRIHIGGYVKLDLLHDFDAIGSTDVFDPLTIPTDGRPGQNTRLHARQSRLNLEFLPNANDHDMRLFVEGDFFGSSDPFRRSRAFFRLRHAYAQIGRLLAGQTWTTFMDESILPSTLDFESPRSVILDRRAVLRWTESLTDHLDAAIAIEDPHPLFDLESASAGGIERAAPDLITRLRYERPHWHLQSAALARLLRYREDSGNVDDALGWGLNFTGRCRPTDFGSLYFQVAFGEGIESYRQAPDAAVDADGRIEVIPLIAWVAGGEINWTERLSSTLVYSAGNGRNAAFQLASAPKAVEYLAANLVFEPIPRLSYGVEFLYGTRTDRDGSEGEAHRIQFSVRYDLP